MATSRRSDCVFFDFRQAQSSKRGTTSLAVECKRDAWSRPALVRALKMKAQIAEADSALKKAPYHAFSSIVDKYAGHATQNLIVNGTHYRLLRPLNGAAGGMRIGSGNRA